MAIKRRFKSFLLAIALLSFIPLAASAGPAIEGTYVRVPGQQFKYDGKSVEVLEFLSFYCGSCYNFEKSIPRIKGNFPKKIKWKIVPVYWGGASSKPSEAYFIAEEAGKGEEMKKALFNAHFVEKKDIGNPDVLEALAAKIGLGFDFSRKLRAGAKAAEAQKTLDIARAYRIDETPTIVIAGNLLTNGHQLDHDFDALRENTITIIRSILKN